MAQCTNRKELLRCSNIALNEIQTYPFNEKGFFMLPFFNQKELVVCSNQSQYQKYTSLLEKEGIGYRTKVRDLSSPSLFSMGTRERTGTAFQKVNCQTIYTIYVRKVDYERAVHVIIV